MICDKNQWFLIRSECGDPWMLIPAASEAYARFRAGLYSLAYPQLRMPEVLHAEELADIQEPVGARLGIIPVAFFEAYELIQAGKQRARKSGTALHAALPDLEQ